MTILGLTLRHPWPVAVRWLRKDVENRLWHPEERGGRVGMYLAIHGGTTPVTRYEDEFVEGLQAVRRILTTPEHPNTLNPALAALWTPEEHEHFFGQLNGKDNANWVESGIVAVTQVVAVLRDGPSRWADAGQYHWVLSGTVRLPQPITPPSGNRKDLWRLDDATLRAVRHAYREAVKPAA